MTADLTQVDYQQLDAMMRRFEQEGEEIRNVQNQLRGKVADLCGRGWQGVGASQFQNEMEHKLLPSLNRTADSLKSASETLKMISRTFQDAEGQAVQLFKQDASGNMVPKTGLTGLFEKVFGVIDAVKDIRKIGGALYVISKMHDIPTRINSVAIHGNAALLKAVGLGGAQHIMRPETLLKEFMKSANPFKAGLIAGLTDGFITAGDTLFNGQYAGTSRAVPAALTDGAVKGTMTGLVTAGLVVGTTALIGVAATPVAAGAAVVGVCVIGGFVIDKVVVDPLFKLWQQSDWHAQTVDTVARVGDDIKDFVSYQAKTGVDKVQSAFSDVVKSVVNAPAPALSPQGF